MDKNYFWIFLLSLLTLATSQSIPIATLDQILWDTSATMKAKEVKLSNLLADSIDKVDALAAGPAPALSTASSSYKTTLKDFSTISNFDTSKQSSTCADINMKISSIKFDMQKISGLSKQAVQNLTTLTIKMNYVTYYYSLNYGILTGSQVANYVAVVSGFYAISSEVSYYIYFLGVAYNNQTYVMSNLNAYKNSYCSCGSKTKEDSTLESNLAYIQRPLEKSQTRIRAALLASSSAVNLAISQISVTPSTNLVAGNLQFLSDFLAKTSTISDYTKINAGKKTSCDEWQKRRTLVLCLFYEYQKISTQIYSNLTTLNAYLAAVNVTVGTVNLTLNSVQGNALQGACNSMGFASNLFVGYFNDIKHAIIIISSILAEITSVGDSYCGCVEKQTTTEAATTEETTTMMSAIEEISTEAPTSSTTESLIDSSSSKTSVTESRTELFTTTIPSTIESTTSTSTTTSTTTKPITTTTRGRGGPPGRATTTIAATTTQPVIPPELPNASTTTINVVTTTTRRRGRPIG